VVFRHSLLIQRVIRQDSEGHPDDEANAPHDDRQRGEAAVAPADRGRQQREQERERNQAPRAVREPDQTGEDRERREQARDRLPGSSRSVRLGAQRVTAARRARAGPRSGPRRGRGLRL
jgi:hypothetical protein